MICSARAEGIDICQNQEVVIAAAETPNIGQCFLKKLNKLFSGFQAHGSP
jgi:hypothetical protein